MILAILLLAFIWLYFFMLGSIFSFGFVFLAWLTSLQNDDSIHLLYRVTVSLN